MNDDPDEFSRLYDAIEAVMDEYTTEKSIPIGLYDIFGGDNGKQISMYVAHMEYIQKSLIKKLQTLLVHFPKREIVYSVTCPEDVDKWPIMGLYIRANFISDGLLRQYFPPEYQSITYEGSRPGDKYDTFIYENKPAEFKPLIRRIDGVFAAAAARRGLTKGWSFEVYDEAPGCLVLFATAPMMQPDVIAAIQGILRDFPDWVLVIAPDVMPDVEDRAMFVQVHHDEIVDRLDRSRLPPEYVNLHYPGARRAKPFKIPRNFRWPPPE